MEKIPPVENQERVVVTPELVLAEIHSKFPDSRSMYNHVKEIVDHNFIQLDQSEAVQKAVNHTLHRLASIRRSGRLLLESSTDGDINKEQAEQFYKEGALIGLLVSAVYYGEATFIGERGELLKDARTK